MPIDEILESNEQFLKAWRFFARHSATGEVLDLPDVHIASSNVSWMMLNVAFLRSPLKSAEELQRAGAAAAGYFAPRGNPWMLAVCEDWLAPDFRPRAAELLAPYGLQTGMDTTGMVTDSLAAPLRPLPEVELRQAVDTKGRNDVADINAHAYDAPQDVVRAALDVPAYFAGEGQGVGYVAWRNGEAASSTTVFPIDGVAYVALVATMKQHRQVGCAEAVMRKALAEAHRTQGLSRTVLHATAAGYPVYLRMGYRPVTRIHFFMATASPR
ncbi:GNAT family N-acetyltransferase [Pyxidicoccus xibeiensis]|uniref:GNAT family N-acetyltransferase n=1 Tax=Pyxidicoccus xibeiensis TaxID=2906759 RepID=UPI0020A7928E|nr:GNAT family N-acetyltransferase [Pyxidicoccus xibeiensis]MCP3136954.1 GNAT family N-acetyltransferase [Pyxidicoccus xibeiensis]